MLRVRFEAEDLGRVVFGVAPHAETVGSLLAIHQASGRPFADRWRHTVASRLPAAAAPLLELVPPRGSVPDFLVPEGSGGRPSDLALAQVLATPPQVIAEQLGGRPRSAWVRRLAASDDAALAEFGVALRTYYQACVAGWWDTIHQMLAAELARRAQELLVGGAHDLLGTLGPGVRWRYPVLEVDGPGAGELRLGGRGVKLVPSVFWTRPAVAGGYRQPTITYPIHPAPQSPGTPVGDPLGELLGRGRAHVARALVAGGGTVALAERLGVSPAIVSEHVAVLRRAGLAATVRRGRAVRHSLTPLGLRLVVDSGRAGVSPLSEMLARDSTGPHARPHGPTAMGDRGRERPRS